MGSLVRKGGRGGSAPSASAVSGPLVSVSMDVGPAPVSTAGGFVASEVPSASMIVLG
jgi:hypothetical protein